MDIIPENFLTLPALARDIGITEGPLRRRIAERTLVPDGLATVGGLRQPIPLFRPDRVQSIRRELFGAQLQNETLVQ